MTVTQPMDSKIGLNDGKLMALGLKYKSLLLH